jgi:hypothetical protein
MRASPRPTSVWQRRRERGFLVALSPAYDDVRAQVREGVSADSAAVPIRPGRAVSDRDAIEAAAVREAPGRSIAGAHGVRQETAALSGF